MKRKWLWLLLIPAGVIIVAIAIPFLLMAMLIGTRLLSAVAGPVNFWNTTRHLPPMADFAGYYKLSERSWKDSKKLDAEVSRASGFRLGADHRMEVIDLPAFDGFGQPAHCSYNGTGVWRWYEDGEVTLTLDIKARTTSTGNRPSCDSTSLGGLTLLGHSPPYRFWYYVGDPDDEQGLTYVRQ
jgi:hypothetical protein